MKAQIIIDIGVLIITTTIWGILILIDKKKVKEKDDEYNRYIRK